MVQVFVCSHVRLSEVQAKNTWLIKVMGTGAGVTDSFSFKEYRVFMILTDIDF